MKSKRFTIIDHIRAAGTFGILADDLVALVGAADRWSLNTMIVKLRHAGAPKFVCRHTGDGYRYWMAEHAPKRPPPGAVPEWKLRKDEQLLDMVREAGKPGLCVRVLEQSFSRSVYTEAVARLRRKHLVWASRGTPTNPARYFSCADALDVYLRKLEKAHKQADLQVAPRLQSITKTLAPEAKPVTPLGVKVKVLPSAPVYARHQLPPDAVVPRVISSAECRPWAAVIA